MASVTQKPEEPLLALRSTVKTVSTLLDQLETAIKGSPATQKPPASDVNALFLAHDAAKLIRAHSTKLSLLIINTPFTPSAIVKVLRELAAGPLPSLGTAVELCGAHIYSDILQGELQWRVRKVFSEFGVLLKEIPLDGKVLTDDQKNGTGKTVGKGSLASTGVLWQACDDLAELKNLGIAGVVVRKAEQYRDTLKDAIEELQEWGDESGDEDEDEDEDANTDDEADEAIPKSAQDEIDDFFGSTMHIPSDDPNKIRPRLELSLRRLKLIAVMFSAVIKRRFQTLSSLTLSELSTGDYPLAQDKLTLPKPGSVIAPAYRVDASVDILRTLTELADNLATAFYDLDAEAIDDGMDECFSTSLKVTELLSQDWAGKDDAFTTWAQTFKTEIKK
ncbi:hypothetical protein V499_08660 [Pseudogymnoascus sp. VKM F-103]|uniref:Cyclin-D1-binding protein 1-like N-terminal domain-containing protein n=1 Tax=Pseudogymnoascus verrucosus TaxID=342668 RepID=A0A2P2SY86_9PEZI|nr:uncharacterized protein VE01_00903 [Pseudogymnoascus verrucosus]KFY71135.1 hypothetical protein V499_08660 [Pseudogymnoascus sp. VKM F-103]OBU01215.1 hypothetical protein VE01_00903 [Pseudogymnoascus verrucosus]